MYEALDQSNPSPESVERSFLRRIQSLPTELAQQWEERFYELDVVTPEFMAELDAFIARRRGALAGVIEIEKGLSEDLVDEIVGTQEQIRQTFGDSNYFLGNGRVAEVYEFPSAPRLCVKYVKDQQAYNEGNHLRVEYAFLEDLRGVSISGVRTPLPYFINIHPSEGHSYGMERINGKSLSAVLERPELCFELVELLKVVDRKAVEASLLEYVKELHERKITHGDLHMRNLMVDGGGNFYVIDFGKAKIEEIGQDDEGRRKADIATLTSEIRLFFQKLDKIEVS